MIKKKMIHSYKSIGIKNIIFLIVLCIILFLYSNVLLFYKDINFEDVINNINIEINHLDCTEKGYKEFKNKYVDIKIPLGYQFFYDGDTSFVFRYNRLPVDVSVFDKKINLDQHFTKETNNQKNLVLVHSILFKNINYKIYLRKVSEYSTEINVYTLDKKLKSIVPNNMLKNMLLKNLELLKNITILDINAGDINLNEDNELFNYKEYKENENNENDLKNKEHNDIIKIN